MDTLVRWGFTSTGRDDGEEEAPSVHRRVQGRSREAAGGERQGLAAGGGRAGAAPPRGEAARAGERDPEAGGGFFRPGGGRLMRYRFVAAERAAFPVRTLCRVAGVAASGFYAWLRRRPGRRREDDRRVGERIAAIVAASRRTYGSPRVHAQPRAEGVRVGRKRTARLMREGGRAGAPASRAPPTAG